MLATDRKAQLLTLGACCFGLFMVMLDNTVVNVALPSIQRELGAKVAAGAAAVLFLRPRRADPASAGPPLPAEAA